MLKKLAGVGLVVAVGLGFMQAQGASNPLLDGRALDLNKLEVADLRCEDFCSNIVEPKEGKTLSLSGEIGWAEADDQWCANHKVGTNPTVLAARTLNPLAGTLPCNVPQLEGDGSCADTNKRLQQCVVHNSQLETKCSAYVAITDATKSEKLVMAMDTVAAGTCGVACAGNFVPGGQALVLACGIAGGAAAGAQIIEVLKNSKNSGTQKVIGGVGGGMGAIFATNSIRDGLATKSPTGDYKTKNACIAAVSFGALAGLRAFNMKAITNDRASACKDIRELLDGAKLKTDVAVTVTGAGTGTSGGSTGGAGTGTTTNPEGFPTLTAKTEKEAIAEASKFVRDNHPEFFKDTGDNGQQRALAHDMMTLVINILRYNGHDVGRTIAHADIAAPNPFRWGSDALAYRNGGKTTYYDIYGSYPNPATPGANVIGPGVGDFTDDLVALGTPSNFIALAATAGGLIKSRNTYKSCVSNSKCVSSALSGAMEGDMLRKSGLAALLGPRVASLNMDQIEKHLAAGGSMDAVIGMAMGGNGGKVGAELGALANAMLKDGDKGSPDLSLAPAGGFAFSDAKSHSESSFAVMKDQEPSRRSASVMGQPMKLETGLACDSSDIWHSNCQGSPSIFDIVSKKINQSRSKVEALGWSLDMNRKLSGEKTK